MAVDRQVWKILLDFLILAALAFGLLSVHLWAEPYWRGYFADDRSLRLPYKQQTISEALLACLGFALNIVTILIIEIVRDRSGKSIGDKFLSTCTVPGWVWESYVTIGVFTFGAACSHLTSDGAKYFLGRLRPHFFDVCQPIPASTPEPYEYITEYTCAGQDQKLLKDMRLSFPSAHSSFAMYSAIFFIFYIQTKAKWRGSKLLRHALQYVVFIAAFYVGLSRVVDHMHHWSDVGAGFLIGAAYAALVFIYVLKPKKYGLRSFWNDQPVDLPRPAIAIAR